MKKLISLFSALLLPFFYSFAQLTIEDGNTVNLNQILQQLVGSGVRISNVTLNGSENAYGRFSYTGNTLPLGNGIILSTGFATSAIGPNLFSNTSTSLGRSGDTQLNTLSGLQTLDACVIEFDVEPAGEEINFKYTFASEEYPEFTPCVGQNFNDVFAFFVSGPNPQNASQPYNDINIALIPNTNNAVSINNVNECTNQAFYVNNSGGQELQYDGYTKNLVAILKVIPCQKYHFKLKIADAQDSIYDSAVFIEQLSSNAPTISRVEDTPLIEECNTTANILINRSQTDESEIFIIDFAGQAVANTDYSISLNGNPISTFPRNISFAIGEVSKTITIRPIDDNITENPEKFTFFLKSNCGNIIIDTLEYFIFEKKDIKLFSSPIVYRCKSSDIVEINPIAANQYQWSTTNGSFTCLDAQCRQIKVLTINQESTYQLRATIGSCVFEQSIIVKPSFLTVSNDVTICSNESTPLLAQNRGTYEWTPPAGLSCTDCANPIASPLQTTTYYVKGIEGNCESVDSVKVTVIPLANPQIINLQNEYCVDESPTSLEAQPDQGVFTIQNKTVTQFNPSEWGVGEVEVAYTLQTNANPLCIEKITQKVKINPLPVLSFTDLKDSYCIDAPKFTLSAAPSGGIFTLDNQPIAEVNPSALGAGKYTIQYQYTDPITNCKSSISKEINIYDLPQLSFITTLQDQYCIDENVDIPVEVQIVQSNGNIQKVIAEVLNPSQKNLGDYLLKFSYSDINGCENKIEKTIKINPLPVLSFLDVEDSYCQQSFSFILEAQPAGGIFKINQVETTTFSPTAFQEGDTPLVTYTFTDNNLCTNTISKTVTITPASIFTTTETNLTICPNEFSGFELEAIKIEDLQPGMTFQWLPNGETTRTIQITENSSSDTYSVLITNALNCPLVRKIFNVSIECDPTFFLPSAFSPNADGLNDQLEIFGRDFSDLDLRVYNRWGEIVFTARQKTDSWDGTVNNKPAPAGVYVWKATYRNILKKDLLIQKEGRITLIR